MRHWERTKLTLLCGGCAKHLPKDSPIQVIEFVGVKRKKFRGACCADEAVPEDLPEPPSEAAVLAAKMESIKAISQRIVREYLPHPDD